MVYAKPEVVLKSYLNTNDSIPLLLEDVVDSPKGVPAELFDIGFMQVRSQMTKGQILDWFKSQKNVTRELQGFSFQIPEKIVFEKKPGAEREIIRGRINNRLKVKCTDCDFNIRITHLPPQLHSSLRFDFRKLPLTGPFMISLTNTQGDTTSWISGQIQTQRPVVRTTRFIKANEAIRESDITVVNTDVTYVKDYYTNPKELIGKKLNRTLSAQSILSSQEIARDVDVKQGQTVKAKAGSENFEVIIQAIALDSGAIGDVIRIRNPNYQKMMSARVIEPGLVEIQ
jgi:flagella basal body P-ring formation protein FlgA